MQSETIMPALGRRKDSEYEQAAMLLTNGKTTEAIAILRAIVSRNPAHTNAMVSLAVALIETDGVAKRDSPATKEALDLLDRAASIAPKDPVPLFNKGVCLRGLGMLEEALVAFDAALKREKRLPLAVLHMAEINYELGHWNKAVELARLAVIRDPGLKESLGWVPDAVSKASEQESKSR